jgi:hypothetical protein
MNNRYYKVTQNIFLYIKISLEDEAKGHVE